MYPFSNHNAKGFYTDLIEEALASIVTPLDVRKHTTAFNTLSNVEKRDDELLGVSMNILLLMRGQLGAILSLQA
jgi:hypothetical protein